MSTEATNLFIGMWVNDNLAAYAMGVHWSYEGNKMLWITQLCIHHHYRRRGVSKKLLEALYNGEKVVGILSVNPHAIMAVHSVFAQGIENADLGFTTTMALEVIEDCPVPHVKRCLPRSCVFEDDVRDRNISSAYTGLNVCTGPTKHALKNLGARGRRWPMGLLLDRHEYLSLVRVRQISQWLPETRLKETVGEEEGSTVSDCSTLVGDEEEDIYGVEGVEMDSSSSDCSCPSGHW